MLVMPVAIDERSNPHRLRHVHAVDELLLVDQGQASQLIGPDEVSCRSGDIFVFPAGLPHLSYAASGQSCTVLVTDGESMRALTPSCRDLFASVVQSQPTGGRLPLSPVVAQQVQACFRMAVHEWQHVGLGHQELACAHMAQAIIAMARDCATTATRPIPVASERHVQMAIDYMQRNYMFPLTIADVLGLGNLRRTRFLECFHKHTGQSVGQYLSATRLRHAQARLRQGQALVEVALACGFSHQSHFTRVFRGAFGCPPGAWQRQQLQE